MNKTIVLIFGFLIVSLFSGFVVADYCCISEDSTTCQPSSIPCEIADTINVGPDDGSALNCDSIPECSVGCCEYPDGVTVLSSQAFCDLELGTFDPTLTDLNVCETPNVQVCCGMPGENITNTYLECYALGGTYQYEGTCVDDSLTYYTISGYTKDIYGDFVPSVSITITNPIAQTSTQVISDSNGFYSWNYASGNTDYELSADKVGGTTGGIHYYTLDPISVSVLTEDLVQDIFLTMETIEESACSSDTSVCCSLQTIGYDSLTGLPGTVNIYSSCENWDGGDSTYFCWENADSCEDANIESQDDCEINNELDLQVSQADRQASITWAASNCEAGSYDLYRCRSLEGEDCNPYMNGFRLVESLSSDFYLDSLFPDSGGRFCYGVVGYYSDFELESTPDPDCIDIAEKECSVPGDSYCLDAVTPVVCNSNYQEEIQNSCGQGETCSEGLCVPQDNCELCNSPLGAFKQLVYPADNSYYCSELATCFLDYTPWIMDNYQECLGIETCYDYKSENACLSDNVKCGRGPCEWKESTFSDLGFGVCRPVDQQKQDCSAWDNFGTNLLFNSNTEEVCRLFGECYLSNNVCSSINDITCYNYASNQNDCMNSDGEYSLEGSVQLNQVVSLNEDHSFNKRSDDFFNFGVCNWEEQSVGDNVIYRCVKDSNADGINDCAGNDIRCRKDMEPPVTTLLIPEDRKVPLDLNIPVSVSDNAYGSDIQTSIKMIRLNQQGQGSGATGSVIASNRLTGNVVGSGGSAGGSNLDVPNTYSYVGPSVTQLTANLFSKVIVPGNYIVEYYSFDPAKNLEVIKTEELEVVDTFVEPLVQFNYFSDGNQDNPLYDVLMLVTFYLDDLTCTDTGLGNSGPFLSNSVVDAGTYTFSTADLNAGVYYYSITCEDVFGNFQTSNYEIPIESPYPIDVDIS